MIKGKVCKIFVHHAALDDRIYYKEARTLKDAGYDVNMVCRLQCGAFTDMGGRPVGYPDENGLWDYNGITFYGISKRKGLLGKWKEYKDLVRVGVSLKASVYHCHDDDIALIAAVKIKNLLGNSTKLIWDIHEFYSVSWRDIPKYGVKSILLHFFTYIRKKAINCSDYLITANNVVRGQTLIFNRFKKVEVLENAPVLSIFKEQKQTRKNTDSVVVCHEGFLSFVRGFKEMVSLIESDETIELKIIGTISGKEKKWLADKINHNSSLSKRIQETGWLPYEEVGNAISGCDIGIIIFHPTINNMLAGPPNKLYNYMRYGIPVVSVDLPETRAIISKYRCGIIISDWNLESITQSIRFLIDHPDEAEAMGKRGKEAVFNELSWEHQGKKLLNLYGEMLTNKSVVTF